MMSSSLFDTVFKPASLLVLCSLPLAGCMTPWRHSELPSAPCDVRERDLTQHWSHRVYWCGPKVDLTAERNAAHATPTGINPPSHSNQVATYPLHAGETNAGALAQAPRLPPTPMAVPEPAAPRPPFKQPTGSGVGVLPTQPASHPLTGLASASVVTPHGASVAAAPSTAPLTAKATAATVKVSFYSDGLDHAALKQVDALIPQARAASRIRLRGIAVEKATPEANDQLSVVRAWSVRREMIHQGVDETHIRILYRDPTKTESGVEVVFNAP